MKVAGFTYVRNGFHFDYPFLESIQSVLPIVDEFIAVVGDSHDGTREAIKALNNEKVKIVDTVWDEQMRTGGYIFAQQANIGLDNISKDADWIISIQADEVIHEKDYELIRKAMQNEIENKTVDGFLFDFINFFGDYEHYAPSRRYHQKEIRIIRNDPRIRSYKDSQGFRRFNDPVNAAHEKGEKLHVKKIDAAVYHYSYVKKPQTQLQKHIEFGNRWQPDDKWIEDFKTQNKDGYNYNSIDYLKKFRGTHPAIMRPKIGKQDWVFNYDPAVNNMTVKEKILKLIEDITGKQVFIYKNYKRIN